MMRLRLLALLLFPALLLLGCRDALVDEPLGNGAPPPAAPPGTPPETPPSGSPNPGNPGNTNSIYLKGPATLQLGQQATYRAEAHADALYYTWAVSDLSSGRIEGQPEPLQDGLNRVLNAHATARGAVYLTVTAYNADDERVAQAERVIQVE